MVAPVSESMSRQLGFLKVYAAFTYPFACIPFLYFYFRQHGITLSQYGEMLSYYYLAMVVAEIPTGLAADRYGKRLSMVLGPLLLAVGFSILYGFASFGAFCLGQAVLGIGHAVLSGPPSALLFETLQEENRAHEYLRRESTLHAIRLLGTGLAFLMGGVVVALWGFGPCILLTAALCLVAAAVAVGMREARGNTHIRHPLLRSAGRDLRRPEVIWVLVYFVLLFCLLRYGFHNYQPYLEAVGEDNALLIGTLFCALNLVAAPFSRMAPGLAAHWGPRVVFWAMPLCMVTSFWLMAGFIERMAVGLFFLQQLPFGMHWALVQDFVNHRIQPTARATVLSVLSFSGRVVFVLVSWQLFRLQDQVGISRAFATAGLVGLLATIGCMVWGHRILSPGAASTRGDNGPQM